MFAFVIAVNDYIERVFSDYSVIYGLLTTGKGEGQTERYLGKSGYVLSVAARYFKPQNFLSDNE